MFCVFLHPRGGFFYFLPSMTSLASNLWVTIFLRVSYESWLIEFSFKVLFVLVHTSSINLTNYFFSRLHLSTLYTKLWYYVSSVHIIYCFQGSCDIHDLCYAQHGKSKATCDTEFFENMKNQCRSKNIPVECFPFALIAYNAVKTHSGAEYGYKEGQRSNC